ncbi:hypothetical protein BLNAU_8872 [Blattamonas nauphoetae]|uniref:Uncharacterized protein n=1 Tax=Blattamonas nauphoetae TaxID=2049346 RepID=A0ABQ9XXA1_9EUKA|nr:hypothetical protein BLNAU_8872 [Blattamonas nauphoetae]
MRTDPKNQTYIVTEGGKKKTLEFDADDAGTLTVDSIEKRKRMKSDKLFALEHAEEDKKKAREINARIGKMLKMKEDEADSADLNALMRQKLRESKKLDRLQRTKVGIPDSMKLLPSSPADTAIAHGAVFTPQKPLSIQSLVQGSTSAFSTPSFKKPPPKSSLCPELAEPSQKHQGCREIPQTNALSLLNDYPEESESETDPQKIPNIPQPRNVPVQRIWLRMTGYVVTNFPGGQIDQINSVVMDLDCDPTIQDIPSEEEIELCRMEEEDGFTFTLEATLDKYREAVIAARDKGNTVLFHMLNEQGKAIKQKPYRLENTPPLPKTFISINARQYQQKYRENQLEEQKRQAQEEAARAAEKKQMPPQEEPVEEDNDVADGGEDEMDDEEAARLLMEEERKMSEPWDQTIAFNAYKAAAVEHKNNGQIGHAYVLQQEMKRISSTPWDENNPPKRVPDFLEANKVKIFEFDQRQKAKQQAQEEAARAAAKKQMPPQEEPVEEVNDGADGEGDDEMDDEEAARLLMEEERKMSEPWDQTIAFNAYKAAAVEHKNNGQIGHAYVLQQEMKRISSTPWDENNPPKRVPDFLEANKVKIFEFDQRQKAKQNPEGKIQATDTQPQLSASDGKKLPPPIPKRKPSQKSPSSDSSSGLTPTKAPSADKDEPRRGSRHSPSPPPTRPGFNRCRPKDTAPLIESLEKTQNELKQIIDTLKKVAEAKPILLHIQAILDLDSKAAGTVSMNSKTRTATEYKIETRKVSYPVVNLDLTPKQMMLEFTSVSDVKSDKKVFFAVLGAAEEEGAEEPIIAQSNEYKVKKGTKMDIGWKWINEELPEPKFFKDGTDLPINLVLCEKSVFGKVTRKATAVAQFNWILHSSSHTADVPFIDSNKKTQLVARISLRARHPLVGMQIDVLSQSFTQIEEINAATIQHGEKTAEIAQELHNSRDPNAKKPKKNGKPSLGQQMRAQFQQMQAGFQMPQQPGQRPTQPQLAKSGPPTMPGSGAGARAGGGGGGGAGPAFLHAPDSVDAQPSVPPVEPKDFALLEMSYAQAEKWFPGQQCASHKWAKLELSNAKQNFQKCVSQKDKSDWMKRANLYQGIIAGMAKNMQDGLLDAGTYAENIKTFADQSLQLGNVLIQSMPNIGGRLLTRAQTVQAEWNEMMED